MTALALIVLGLGCGLLTAALILVHRYLTEGPEYLWPEIGGKHD
jgi:hypothetical protein